MGEDKKSPIKSTKSKNSQPKSKKPKKKKRIAFKVIYISLLLIIVGGVAAGFGILSGMIKTAPELNLQTILANGETTFFYDNKGEQFDEYKTPEKRISVDIASVPQYLKDAFISIEDRRFEQHKGVDFRRLAGVIIQDAKVILGISNEEIHGASTITQQLIKYKYFLENSLEDRLNIERKVQEIYLALQLEKVLSKDQILEAYMNTIYLGGDAYGVEAAANFYFDKSVGDLTLKQCAFLASAGQNPAVSFSNALEAFNNNIPFDSPRTKLVLGEMLQYGKITQAEYDAAIAEPLVLNFTTIQSTAMNYEWFSRPVVKQVVADLMKTYGYTETEAYDMITYGGLRIYTTMDKQLQDSVQEIIDNAYTDYDTEEKTLQASGIIMDYTTGEVKAMVGGRGDQPAMSYNRAISIGNDGQTFLRACGSSIKPLTVYAPAIDTQLFTAGSTLLDAPFSPDFRAKYRLGDYSPTNLPNKYDGNITVREAIRQSKNTAAVSLVAQMGLDTSVAYADKFKLSLNDDNKTAVSSLALGQIDGTTPYEMARAFGTFGNQGAMSEGRIYTKVTDKDGKVLLETKYETTQVISPQAAYIVYDMMKGSIGYTGPSAIFSNNMEIRGKTGTTTDYRDLYFAGLTPYYSGAVWIGYDDNSLLPFTGSDASAALWGKIMAVAHEGLESKTVEKPGGLTYATVSKDSGTLATALTNRDPRGNRAYSEMFISGTQPTTLDDVHVELEVVKVKDEKTNKEVYYLPSDKTPKDKIEKVVFIKRDKALMDFYKSLGISLADDKYVAPFDKDPTDYKKLEDDKKDDETKPGDNKPGDNKPEDNKPIIPPTTPGEGDGTTDGTKPVKPGEGGNNGHESNGTDKPISGISIMDMMAIRNGFRR